MRVACLFSGGKDSTYAAFWSIFQGWDVVLVCVKSEEYSYMFHHPNVDKTKFQAKEMGLKIHYVKTTKENELKDLESELKKLKIEGIVTGALASEYQRQRIDVIGESLNVPTFSPIWHKSSVVIDEIKEYFKTYIVAVSAEGLTKEHLGMRFKDLGKIKYIHPMLEGGEGETYVSYAPFFKKEIKIKSFKKKWDKIRGVAKIEI